MMHPYSFLNNTIRKIKLKLKAENRSFIWRELLFYTQKISKQIIKFQREPWVNKKIILWIWFSLNKHKINLNWAFYEKLNSLV